MDSSGLFVIIVPFTLGYGDAFFADPVDEPVSIVDPPAPFPPQGCFSAAQAFLHRRRAHAGWT